MSDLNFLKQLRQKLESLSNQTTSESKGAERLGGIPGMGWATDKHKEKSQDLGGIPGMGWATDKHKEKSQDQLKSAHKSFDSLIDAGRKMGLSDSEIFAAIRNAIKELSLHTPNPNQTTNEAAKWRTNPNAYKTDFYGKKVPRGDNQDDELAARQRDSASLSSKDPKSRAARFGSDAAGAETKALLKRARQKDGTSWDDDYDRYLSRKIQPNDDVRSWTSQFGDRKKAAMWIGEHAGLTIDQANLLYFDGEDLVYDDQAVVRGIMGYESVTFKEAAAIVKNFVKSGNYTTESNDQENSVTLDDIDSGDAYLEPGITIVDTALGDVTVLKIVEKGVSGEPANLLIRLPNGTKKQVMYDELAGYEPDDYTIESIRRAVRAAPLLKECGEMAVGAPQQTNSSTVNISFNGSGTQGIRDIMNVLRDIEDEMQQASDSSNDDHEGMEMPIVIKPHDEEPEGDEFEEDYANSPDEEYHDVDDVINPPSNDLNSPHKSYKHNPLGGDNKMAEGIAQRLLAQYKLSTSSPAQLDEISSELASSYRDKSIVAQYKAAKDGDIATKEKRKAGHLNANKRIKSLPLSAYGDEIQKRDYSGKPGSRTGD